MNSNTHTQNTFISSCAQSVLAQLQHKRPLVESLTNTVTINNCANVVLALGGSPIMASYAPELPDIIAVADAVLINIGQMNDELFACADVAIKEANKRGICVVIDPVGAAATKLRADYALKLLSQAKRAIIKANAAEISALIAAAGITNSLNKHSSGLDCDYSFEDVASALEFAKRFDCVVFASAKVDFVCNEQEYFQIPGGSALCTQITGAGCMLGHAVAVCAGVSDNLLQAALAASYIFKQAANLAENKLSQQSDLGSFNALLINELAGLKQANINRKANIEAKYLNKYLKHPFICELADATLPKEKFRNYLVQDFIYLKDYARVFAIGLAKAKTTKQKQHLERSCNYFANEESLLHEYYLKQLGLVDGELNSRKAHIDNLAYTSYMLRIAYEGDMLQILAAVLACALSYEQIARAISKSKAASDEFYHYWLDEYLSDEYHNCNERLCELYEEEYARATTNQRAIAEQIYENCLHFELKFWDLAYEGC